MNKNNIIKYGWLLLGIVFLVFIFKVYENYNNNIKNKNWMEKITENQINPICPDDFKDPKQEIASFSEWVREFTEKYSNATNSDLSEARKNFYIENNCTEALKRYKDYMNGNVDEETKQLIEIAIKQEMKNKIINLNKLEEYEKALISAKEYVSLYPEDQEGWVHRGYAYFGLGNCAEATSDFTHASMNGNEDGSKLLTMALNSEVCK